VLIVIAGLATGEPAILAVAENQPANETTVTAAAPADQTKTSAQRGWPKKACGLALAP
jgi:hypothetical protein